VVITDKLLCAISMETIYVSCFTSYMV